MAFEFQEPVLGKCRYTAFYITNNLYGGYSARCEKGSIATDYADPKEVIKLAKTAMMNVHLAGDAWKEIGRAGWGELVTPSEAEGVLRELAKKRGFPPSLIRESSSSSEW